MTFEILTWGHTEFSNALLKAKHTHRVANDDHISAEYVAPLAFWLFWLSICVHQKTNTGEAH